MKKFLLFSYLFFLSAIVYAETDCSSLKPAEVTESSISLQVPTGIENGNILIYDYKVDIKESKSATYTVVNNFKLRIVAGYPVIMIPELPWCTSFDIKITSFSAKGFEGACSARAIATLGCPDPCSGSGYYLSAQVSASDLCCISVGAGSTSAGCDDKWWVEVSGGGGFASTHTDASDGNNFTRCATSNGTFTVNLYVDGYPGVYFSDVVTITGCNNDPCAGSGYYFSAQVSANDPCCISIGAGSTTAGCDDEWTVEVVGGGLSGYDHAGSGNNFQHCVTGNGTFTVNFYVDGYPGVYWSDVVNITGCGNACAGSGYYFSAQVSANDPCCISIGAGSTTAGCDDEWTVEVVGGGLSGYDHAGSGNNFQHCVTGNGTFTVNFYVDGYPGVYWSDVVNITGCGNACAGSGYYFSAQVSANDPCCISIGAGSTTAGCDDEWTVEVIGGGLPIDYDHAGSGNNFQHCVTGNGTFTVNFYVDGYPGVYWSDVVNITGCGNACAGSGYYFSAQVSANDPCCISIGAGSTTAGCDDEWTVEVIGGGLPIDYDHAGSGNNFQHCVTGNGTFTVNFYVDGYPGVYWSNVVTITGCNTPIMHNLNCSVSLVTANKAYLSYTPISDPACANPYYNIGWKVAGANNWNYCCTSDDLNGSAQIFGLDPCTNYEFVIELKCSGGFQGQTVTQCTGTFKTKCIIVGPVIGISGPIGGGVIVKPLKEGSNKKATTEFGDIFNGTFNIYPNPAKDVVNVSVNSKLTDYISVIDVTGKEVITQKANADSDTSIDISNLYTGVYFIKTTDTNGEVAVKRFIKTE